MSRGFSGGKQVIKFANTGNRSQSFDKFYVIMVIQLYANFPRCIKVCIGRFMLLAFKGFVKLA